MQEYRAITGVILILGLIYCYNGIIAILAYNRVYTCIYRTHTGIILLLCTYTCNNRILDIITWNNGYYGIMGPFTVYLGNNGDIHCFPNNYGNNGIFIMSWFFPHYLEPLPLSRLLALLPYSCTYSPEYTDIYKHSGNKGQIRYYVYVGNIRYFHVETGISHKYRFFADKRYFPVYFGNIPNIPQY